MNVTIRNEKTLDSHEDVKKVTIKCDFYFLEKYLCKKNKNVFFNYNSRF